MNIGHYKKLAEFILMKTDEETPREDYIFQKFGSLRQIIIERLDNQRKEDIPDILSEIKQH